MHSGCVIHSPAPAHLRPRLLRTNVRRVMRPPEVPRPTIDLDRPFTRAQALTCGLTPRMLRGPKFWRVIPGVYAHVRVPKSARTLALAGLCLHPSSAFVSHQSAATLRRVPIPAADRVHVSVADQEDRAQNHGVMAHVACAEVEVEKVQGIRVSSPLDMFIELASSLSLVDLVVAGDAMVGMRMFTADELRHFCAATKRRHSRRARRAAAYVRDGVDSPMETRLRMLLVLAGLPEPVVNYMLKDAAGNVRRRLDLSYPHLKLIIEYDGRQHAEDLEQWHTDIERREEFDVDGWRIIVVTGRGVFREPHRTLNRVVAALRDRGVRVRPLTNDWRVHFPTY
jgi:hypothetical protein